MKKIFWTIVAILLLFFIARIGINLKGATDVEFHVMNSTFNHCLPPILERSNVAAFLEKQKMPELPQEKAVFFSKDNGRVFIPPTMTGKFVIAANKSPICQIIVRELDAKRFWLSVDHWMSKNPAFKKVDEKLSSTDAFRMYQADMNGKINILISARNKPAEKGAQSVISVGRQRD